MCVYIYTIYLPGSSRLATTFIFCGEMFGNGTVDGSEILQHLGRKQNPSEKQWDKITCFQKERLNHQQ